MRVSLVFALLLAVTAPLVQADVFICGGAIEKYPSAGGQLCGNYHYTFVPSPDYEIITQKLKAAQNLNVNIRRMVQKVQVTQVTADPNMVEMMLNDITGGSRSTRDKGLSEPLDYVMLGKVQIAQMRAQFWSNLLVLDLDNDGQVTEQELRDTLSVSGEVVGAAQAFFYSDSNADHILSASELRAAVDHLLATRGGYRAGDRAELPRIFDFDDDGLLTQAEFDRAMVALGYGR